MVPDHQDEDLSRGSFTDSSVPPQSAPRHIHQFEQRFSQPVLPGHPVGVAELGGLTIALAAIACRIVQ